MHLFVSYPPHLAVSDMMQKIKGKSSYKIFSVMPNLRKIFWGKHFWSRGYLAISTGNITDEMIQEYIENQGGEAIQGDLTVES